jgi:hypothetical protein
MLRHLKQPGDGTMRIRRNSLAVPGAIVLASALAYADISVHFDETVDFTRFESYGWREGTPSPRRTAQQRIVDAVERELDARGMRKVDASPDLYVTTHVLVDAHTLEELSDDTEWLFWTGITSVDAVTVGAGTLVVDLLDAESQEIVWRGLATEKLAEIPDKNLKKIDRVVKKLFKRLP